MRTATSSITRRSASNSCSSTSISPSYDANGNTIQNDLGTFHYGEHNRLSEVLAGGVAIATYTHNGRGERVKKDTR